MDCLEDIAVMVIDHYVPISQANVNFRDPDLTRCSYNKIYQLMLSNGWIPKIIPKEKKSNIISEKLRTKGNQAYVKSKDNVAAIKLYTKAICAALPQSKEIALAYANRSAVTFDLQKYSDSIIDIDRALTSGNYPDHLKHKLYARRGKCYMALSQYSKALEDFKLAKNDPQYSELKSASIDSLLECCHDKPDLPLPSFVDPIKLSHGPSPYIECASAAVDIKYSSKFGRHIVASLDIKPGDVLSIEKPFVTAAMPEVCMDLCYNCLKKCLSAVPCTSCTTVIFCSDECRQSSWTAYHSVECDILPSIYAMLENSLKKRGGAVKAIVALKILLVASKCGTNWEMLTVKKTDTASDPSKLGLVNGKYVSDDYSAIHHLSTNIESTCLMGVTIFSVMALALLHLLKEGTKFFDGSDASVLASKQSRGKLCSGTDLALNHLVVADLLLKYVLKCNVHACSIPDASPSPVDIGCGIYSFHSLFNHSCDPNVAHVPCKSDNESAVAIKPILKGQQVFVDYGFNYNTEPRDYRQDELKFSYNFTCKCPPCTENWPMMIFAPVKPIFKQTDAKHTILKLAERLETVAEEVNRGAGTEEDFDFLVQFITLASQNVKLPWRSFTTSQEALKMYMLCKANPEKRPTLTQPICDASDVLQHIFGIINCNFRF